MLDIENLKYDASDLHTYLIFFPPLYRKCYMRMRGLQCELKFQILPNIIRVQNSTKNLHREPSKIGKKETMYL